MSRRRTRAPWRCARCGRPAQSQCKQSNMSDDLVTWPLDPEPHTQGEPVSPAAPPAAPRKRRRRRRRSALEQLIEQSPLTMADWEADS